MPLKIYNTLTRKKEEFKPLVEGHVGMYVCGPTVYGHSHIGHAKSYVSFDVIVRYLRHLRYNVAYIQNVTDVGHLLGETNEGEDRMVKQSKLEHKHPMEIAEYYTRSYFEDMDALGVVRPDISPRATGHIIEQIELVKKLLEKGYAYEANGSVYFDVSRDREYGKLSGRNLDEMESGTRVEVKSEKRHPNDFALWKKAEPEHIMQWPSPWGMGFPGWHIECSAMSMKYLGESFDIHGGGLDNQFPHHECEIAQSECVTGKPFAKYWIHNNLVTVNGQKMSKSLGNVTLLKDLFKKYDPLVVRFFILQSHYRGTLDFSESALEAARAGLTKLHNTVNNFKQRFDFANKTSSFGFIDKTAELDTLHGQLIEALNDDFNAPRAIAVLFDLVSSVNNWLPEMSPNKASFERMEMLFGEFGTKILGLIPEKTEQGSAAKGLDGELMDLIISLRAEARAQKLFSFSDKIRDGLAKLGIVLEDKKEGTTWKKST
ncbi:MAG: cysteine--tRNA ligase [Bacteroidota bacterium]|jgi:cysteinyl-tRNA synthetase